MIASATYADTKKHYELLDGLRGVAALLVIWYHIYECFPSGHIFPHGYLAVDFFFILSGFVIGYAYDDRWKKMGMKDFFKRRLIRLQPMVIMGAVIGAVTFLIQGSQQWDGSKIGLSAVMLAMLLGMFMIPAVPGASYEVRGNGEMFPLNGPQWSLFFEYIANIVYAVFLRRLSTKLLAAFTFIAGVAWVVYSVIDPAGYGSLGVGWTVADHNLLGGILRSISPFCIGMLMSRTFKPMKIRGAFWICSVLLVVLLLAPNFSNESGTLYNRMYELVCVMAVFPFIVYMGASGTTTDAKSTAVCRFLGDISYPLYIIHYPTMYLFYYYIGFDGGVESVHLMPGDTIPQQWLLFVGNVVLAYILLKVYDTPVRKFLAKKFLKKG